MSAVRWLRRLGADGSLNLSTATLDDFILAAAEPLAAEDAPRSDAAAWAVIDVFPGTR
jgi:hypothetical protein